MRDLSIYKLLGEGVSWIIGNLPEDVQPYRTDIFPDKYKKQNPLEPSSTIVAHISKDGNIFIHPREARTFTVREAARLQSELSPQAFFKVRGDSLNTDLVEPGPRTEVDMENDLRFGLSDPRLGIHLGPQKAFLVQQVGHARRRLFDLPRVKRLPRGNTSFFE